MNPIESARKKTVNRRRPIPEIRLTEAEILADLHYPQSTELHRTARKAAR